jgi:hypothetical protein
MSAQGSKEKGSLMSGIESTGAAGAGSLLSGAKQSHGKHQRTAGAGGGIASSLETASTARSGSDYDTYAAEAKLTNSQSPTSTGSLMDMLA